MTVQVSLTLLYFVLLAGFGLAGYWVFFSVPHSLRSIFEQRLWRLRDELFDACYLSETIAPSEDVAEWVRFMHSLIQTAKVLTPYRLLIFVPILWRQVRARARQCRPPSNPASFDGMWNATDGLLWYERRTLKLVGVHLILGSPSGWLLLPALALVFAVTYPTKLLRGHKHPQREVFQDAMTELYPLLTTLPRGGNAPRMHPPRVEPPSSPVSPAVG